MMNKNTIRTILLLAIAGISLLCSCKAKKVIEDRTRYDFANIINISLTPEGKTRQTGCFTDAGSWMGFTLPEKNKWINGFCGPFSIYDRIWFAQSIVEVNMKDKGINLLRDSTSYFPGELYIKSSGSTGIVEQRLNFIDTSTALLRITNNTHKALTLGAKNIHKDVTLHADLNNIVLTHPKGEIVVISFPADVKIETSADNYIVNTDSSEKNIDIAISFLMSQKELETCKAHNLSLLNNTSNAIKTNEERWNNYLSKVLRPDIPHSYNRIAVKSIVTLISNWRSQRGGILHDAIIPSHAVNYFVGCWAWDCWRFSAAMASFFPELAKDNIRAMFDYQQPDGMVIDCIYPDPTENNARDSKPPLACWAVDAIYEQTGDTDFIKEMYPQLLSYYKWWYEKRDHDKNGICEFGSVDGTLEAAAWESGMDNAIRFDDAVMVKNGDNAWSINQESVDLNSYLALECTLLKKFANILHQTFDGPDYRDKVASYFFDSHIGYFCDKRLKDHSFVEEPGCEGYIPFWTKIAGHNQFTEAMKLLEDKNKFSTYIPFPTVATDNAKCDSNGYWRGPIWLDQTYFAIKGLRNYGETEKANKYTEQVFDRLRGLTGDAPIYENYATHSGQPLQSSHFSWSAAHLLMLYQDYKRK
jgi:putative isomerase